MSKATKIDRFTQRRISNQAPRFMKMKSAHEAWTRAAWIGMLCRSFDDGELLVLARGGYLSPLDLRELKAIGRMASHG